MINKSKSSYLQIRISPEDKSRIVRYAKKAKMGISEWVLNRALPRKQQVFQGLLAQLKTEPSPRYILADIHDMFAAASADEFEQMVAQSPAVALSEYLANYIAAMIEYTAAKKGIKEPSWVSQIPPLDIPVFASNLKSLRVYLLTHSPPPFRRRNVFIDATVGQRV